MEAVQFDGKIWGYPVSVEAVTQVYNKDLLDEPLPTFEDIGTRRPARGRGADPLGLQQHLLHHAALMANGGYAFQKIDGSYDGNDTGVNNAEGAIEGAEVLKSLIDEGVMPPGVDYGVMDGAMNKGEVAMVMNGPWSWRPTATPASTSASRRSRRWTAPPRRRSSACRSLAINAASPNNDLAVEFIENYLTHRRGPGDLEPERRPRRARRRSARPRRRTTRSCRGMLEVAANGVPMPSNPEMGAFWSAMQPALTNITTGAQSPADALNDAAEPHPRRVTLPSRGGSHPPLRPGLREEEARGDRASPTFPTRHRAAPRCASV